MLYLDYVLKHLNEPYLFIASNLTSMVVKKDALSCRTVNISQLTANGDRC